MPRNTQKTGQAASKGPDESQLLVGPDGTTLVDISTLPDAYDTLNHDDNVMPQEAFVANAQATCEALLLAKNCVCSAWQVELLALGQDHAAFGDLNSAIGSLDSYEKGWQKVLQKMGDGTQMDDLSIKDNGVGRQTREEVIAYFARARDDLQKEVPKFRALYARASAGWAAVEPEAAEDSHSRRVLRPRRSQPTAASETKTNAKARRPSAFSQFKKEQRAKLRQAADGAVNPKPTTKRNAKSVGDSAGSSPDSKHAKPSSDTGGHWIVTEHV